ncbi:hypothetical protein XENTR_v10013171 [Xenopus tropicalis]|uniref:tRNA (adenine(58)-N(1))-methyltransferase n=1 Tax=Xenopus tropicalis TaxID=8364 RepID=A0A803JGG6_XENTR|nr:tRNA (adenine(58)-N(1))-methyltransferase, mitochondrial isoform X1 [Xenopus tropicalis]KAE8600281.1 hypothetical protein XENTR_v10013171 [Xenopus tropicalis]
MLQRWGGRVASLCQAVSGYRVPPCGCQAVSGYRVPPCGCQALLTCRHHTCPPGAGHPKGNTDSPGDGPMDTPPGLDTSPPSDQPRFVGGSRAWGRSLSPLHRLSQMLPPQFLSPEIQDLRSAESEEPLLTHSPPEGSSGLDSQPDGPPAPLGTAFAPGDLVIAEFKRRHYTEFKKMFSLTDSGKLNSNWGVVGHMEIVGKLPGQRLRTSRGFEFLLKRPSLEEYILLMKRGPTISYPKDIAAMLMMMDVSPGDVVLEAGSGSGGMTLFLSRAVGLEGRVYSFEVRADHHAIAKKNVSKWRSAWDVRSRNPWPENVHFINQDLSAALPTMGSVAFDAAALDMLNPQVALPAILTCLKQGGVCAVYVANITQVIDLLEGIRSCRLPLLCEKIQEMSVKDWLVAPSVRKDGTVSQRVEPQGNTESELEGNGADPQSDTEMLSNAVKPFGQVPYIARPLPWQAGHTAFLVQLRKIRAAPTRTEPEESS